jgi:hypothetical protein
MTIYGLLKNTTFGPEEIERLVPAYEQTLRALGLKDRSDPITLAGWGLKTRRRFPSWLLKSWEIEAADSPLCSLLNISPPIALWRETA